MNELNQIVQLHHRLRHIARGASVMAVSRPEGVILPRQQGAPTSTPWLHEQLRWTAAQQRGFLRYGCDQILAADVVKAAGMRTLRASHTAGTTLRQP